MRDWVYSPLGRRVYILRGTVLELGRVALAKLGHNPMGMGYIHSPWREAIPGTYRAHRDWVMAADWPRIHQDWKATKRLARAHGRTFIEQLDDHAGR